MQQALQATAAAVQGIPQQHSSQIYHIDKLRRTRYVHASTQECRAAPWQASRAGRDYCWGLTSSSCQQGLTCSHPPAADLLPSRPATKACALEVCHVVVLGQLLQGLAHLRRAGRLRGVRPQRLAAASALRLLHPRRLAPTRQPALPLLQAGRPDQFNCCRLLFTSLF
jgi:hypothetical protein